MKGTWRPRLIAFGRDENGSMTIEAMLWIPFFFTMLLLIVQATMVFTAKTTALRVMQDANRAFAVGRIASTADTQAYVSAHLAKLSPHATVTTTLVDNRITTTVAMPAAELSGVDVFPGLRGARISVSAQQMKGRCCTTMWLVLA